MLWHQYVTRPTEFMFAISKISDQKLKTPEDVRKYIVKMNAVDAKSKLKTKLSSLWSQLKLPEFRRTHWNRNSQLVTRSFKFKETHSLSRVHARYQVSSESEQPNRDSKSHYPHIQRGPRTSMLQYTQNGSRYHSHHSSFVRLRDVLEHDQYHFMYYSFVQEPLNWMMTL